jgi:hypothetical protein
MPPDEIAYNTECTKCCDWTSWIYMHYQRRTRPSSMSLSWKILYLRSYTWLYLEGLHWRITTNCNKNY